MIKQIEFLIIDLKRWKTTSFKDFFYLFFEQGIWATILYRICRFLYLVNIPVIKIILRFISFIIYKLTDITLGVAISGGTSIGPGLYIGHCGLIRVARDAVIGKNLSIGPGVIIGKKGGGHLGSPQIGDNVYIGTGAKVLGNIKIGNNVKIGANAVIVKDIPDNATAIGNPSKIIEKK